MDDLSDDADLLEVISSDEEMREKEKMTLNSSKNRASVSAEPRGGGGEIKKEKGKGKEKVEEVRDGENKKKKRKRRSNSNPTGAIPVAWRTRSFFKDQERVKYTSCYKNGESEEEEEEEEFGSKTDSGSSTSSNSDSEKKSKSTKHITVKDVAHCSVTDTRDPPLPKETDSDCSLDIDEVPLIERTKKMKNKNNTNNEEGCSGAHLEEEINIVPLSSSSDDEGETVKNVEKKRKRVRETKRRKRSGEKIPDKDLFDLLMRSLDAEEGEEVPESSNQHLGEELPLVFDFGSEDEPPVEKSEFEELEDELWEDFDLALGMENLGSYKPDEAQARRDADYIATCNYCSNGEHEMHLDEQIGYICKHCSYIEKEIRDIFPAFATRSRKIPVGRNQMDENESLRYEDLHEQTTEIRDKPESSFQKTGTVWDLVPGLIETMYPHQKEAFEFMWKNLAGGTSLSVIHNNAPVRSDKLGGCVISHAPGTGKTRLAIVFIQSYIKAFPDCNPVVIAPASLMHTWDTEFKKWGFGLPFHVMNSDDFTGKEDKQILDLTSGLPQTKELVRMIKLFSWRKGNSVLGISYPLFNKYISDKSNVKNSRERELLLSKPGLLILDEGHIPRNEHGQLWNAFTEVETEKRIILSGTPFQNSFLELFNTLCLVRPKFAKNLNVREEEKPNKKKEKYFKDIWNTPTKNVTAAKVEEVRSLLKPFVHVYNGEILKSLPGIRECVITLHPEAIQNEVIQKLGKVKNSGTFDSEHKTSLASIHPYLLTSITNFTERETSLLDISRLKNLRNDPYAGVKTKFIVEFIRLLNSNYTTVKEERVLIFSQYIEPLILIKEQLVTIFHWTEGEEVLRIHGKIPTKERERFITSFNDTNSKARVLLASTKSCSEGISLTGASRVVLLDVVWNPSVGKQAISRAFRIGQERVVYTYNLIAAGTDEMEKYDVQMQKEKLSKLVFYSPGDDGGLRDDVCELAPEEDRALEAITSNEKLKGMFAKIYYTKSDDWLD